LIGRVTQALEKALGAWSAGTDGDIGEFFRQAATELLHAIAPSFAGVAIVTRGSDGAGIVARPRGVSALPDETLRGFLAEIMTNGGVCKVKDHALDTVRFIDAHFRTSIVVAARVPAALGQGSEMVVWAGLLAGATPKLIAEMRALTEELSRWLESNSTTLLVIRESRRRISEARERVGEMTSVAHDVRAPLAALSYLLSDLTRSHPSITDDARKIQAEISYIDSLMEGFSPAGRECSRGDVAQCDVVAALRRVASRFARHALDGGISFCWDVPYEEAFAAIDSLSFERALTNTLGNAIKHSGTSEVRFEVIQEEGSVVARVVDCGIGIPRAVLERIVLADSVVDVALDAVRATAGWGVGLLSSKGLVERGGGSFRVSSTEGHTCIEIEVPRAEVARGRGKRDEPTSVAARPAPAYNQAQVVLVDDDAEHSRSLARVLGRAGIVAKIFESVEAALTYLGEDELAKIVCDARMPDGGAERMLKELRRVGNTRSVAVMSGDADDESLYRFAALGASEFFSKPIDAERLRIWAATESTSEANSQTGVNPPSRRRFTA
jgi:signal transduction histidine kinase/ActR/RegA family two-component response regulator